MSVDPPQKNEKEYIQALVGIVLAGCLVLMALVPIAGLVLGFAVRCYRWAAG